MIARQGHAMTLRDWLLLLTLAACFSGSFFFNRVALAELPPLTIVLGRVGLGAVALNLVLRLRGERLPTGWEHWRAFLIMGAFSNALPFVLIVSGQTRIASSLASILNATTPLWTILVAHVLTRDEKLTPNRLLGVLIGLGGAIVVVGPTALLGIGREQGVLVGQLLVLGAPLCYAFAVVYGRRFRGQPPLVTAAGQLTGATLWLVPVTLVVDRPWVLEMPEPRTIGAVAGLGLVCSAVAYVLFFRILAAAGPTNLALVTFLVPVGAVLLGTTVLAEHLEPRHMLGMAVIFLGLATVDGRLPAAIGRLVTFGGATERAMA
jgi:drug/metabolite transporter (DMT)-like permease